jgi:hypothetical protein
MLLAIRQAEQDVERRLRERQKAGRLVRKRENTLLIIAPIDDISVYDI